MNKKIVIIPLVMIIVIILFKLVGTSHQTGISEYFTWDYEGEENILIPEKQEISISIYPNGNVMGSVSVDILEN